MIQAEDSLNAGCNTFLMQVEVTKYCPITEGGWQLTLTLPTSAARCINSITPVSVTIWFQYSKDQYLSQRNQTNVWGKNSEINNAHGVAGIRLCDLQSRQWQDSKAEKNVRHLSKPRKSSTKLENNVSNSYKPQGIGKSPSTSYHEIRQSKWPRFTTLEVNRYITKLLPNIHLFTLLSRIRIYYPFFLAADKLIAISFHTFPPPHHKQYPSTAITKHRIHTQQQTAVTDNRHALTPNLTEFS